MIVAKISGDLRLGVICQSNLGIAGFLRKIFKYFIRLFILLGSRVTFI